MANPRSWDLGLDVKIVDGRTNERPFLIFVFLLMYVAYAALGRDIFFNHLNSVDAADTDIIGRFLPYIRATACAIGVLVVITSAGLTWGLSKIPLIFAPYCAWALVTCSWSDNLKDSLAPAGVLMLMWIAMPMIVHRLGIVQTVRSSLHLIAVVVIASALLAIFVPSIGRHTGLEVAQQVHAGRWRGIFLHKNALGPWAAYGSVFLLTHSWMCKGPRLYWMVAWVCALLCLVFCGSANAVVLFLFLCVATVMFWMLRRYSLLTVLLCVGVPAATGALAIYYASDVMLGLLGRDASFTGRTAIWPLAIDFIQQRPWLGYGFGTLGGADFLATVKYTVKQAIPGPENGYLNVFLETGTIGAIFFFIPYFITIRNGFEWLKHVRIEDRAALEFELMVLTGTLVFAFSDTSSLICTGFDGVLAYGGFFALMTTPQSPDTRLKREFRLAKYRIPSSTAAG